MMTSDYFEYNQFINHLSFVLSIGYHFKFSTKSLEKRIVESKYFSGVLENKLTHDVFMNDFDIAKSIFPELDLSNIGSITYNECEWAAYAYAYILDNKNVNFEILFLYLPIQKMYELFNVYHEMDLSQTLDLFNDLRHESVISKKMKLLKITNQDLSKLTNVSISTINFLRNRRTNISKLSFLSALNISKALDINVETLLNN